LHTTLRNEIPSERIYEDDHVLAIRDINPKAPTHVLVLPKGPHISLMDFSIRATSDEIGNFFQTVAKITELLGLHNKGFRLVANTGADSGQIVPHFHVHLLGGKQLGPMAEG